MKRLFSAFGLVLLFLILTETSLFSQKDNTDITSKPQPPDSVNSRLERQASPGYSPNILPPALSTDALKDAMLQRVKALRNLEFSADMTVKFNGMTQMGNCDAKICSADSMCVTIHGPFGIFVGKMFATPTDFVFYDAFNNRVVTGVPNANNIAKTLRIPLSGEDFAHLMRGEAPTSFGNDQKMKEFTLSSDRLADANLVLFVRRSETFGAEYVLFSLKDKVITQFQKKSPEGKILLNVKYSNFKIFNDILLAQSIDIQSPENDASAIMTLSSFKINQDIPVLRFTVPKVLQTIHLD
ncbi:MAG: DUF4292 domain-containing protein [Ignavibacteriae bacterium]|nr:DUF4292 domain-containing protein [Ignavibacteriota bacterium]